MDLELKDIGQFIGTEQYHKGYLNTLLTDGVVYIMENGYSWFVNDAISVLKYKKINNVFIKLKANTQEHTAVITIEDGNGNIYYSQNYEYTDAKVDELILFYQNNVLMLIGEY